MSQENSDEEINDIINKTEPTKEELETFKNLVNEWFKLDDVIRKLVVALKERKNHQRVLNNKIEDFMFKYQYNDLNTQNGRLKASVKTSHKPVNIKEVKEILEQNKNLKGEELLEKIFNKEERPVTTKKVIKRVIPKVSLSLDI
ncbi:MAG: hypothetical protein EBU80_12185 [Chitinophagia bacterium]|jgi:hypothetical protein|nr:hypothetical protein [Chitinophagia bacterium]